RFAARLAADRRGVTGQGPADRRGLPGQAGHATADGAADLAGCGGGELAGVARGRWPGFVLGAWPAVLRPGRLAGARPAIGLGADRRDRHRPSIRATGAV